jgi:hypothetical protein
MSQHSLKLQAGAFEGESVLDWLRKWSPQSGQEQWRDGKSAKELAKQWFPSKGGPVIPSGLCRLLECHEVTANLVIEHAQGEKVVPLDDYKGKTRHTDLVLTGSTRGHRVLVHIKAKADEPFGSQGRSVAEAMQAAVQANPRSKVPDRVANLCSLLFDSRGVSALTSAVKYQLLYSAGGALMDAESQGAEIAVFVIHELIPRSTNHRFRMGTTGVSGS